MATGSIGSITARDRATPAVDRLEQEHRGIAPERLSNATSALDRLVADAGPLGKFRTDQPEMMPSGTSAFTTPIAQTVAHIEADLASPNERVLGSTQAALPREAVLPAHLIETDRLAQPAAQIRAQAVAPRPDIRSDTAILVAALLHGNRTPSGA